MAGVAAREVEKRAGRKVNRVTVLGGEEEAGPARAEFVDVVVCGGEGREEGEVKERVEFVVVEKGGGGKGGFVWDFASRHAISVLLSM